ncbi:MAG: hypothetical protein ACW98I_20195 [Candidatus Hodarchaeales archaeon]|jgi:ribonuclease D
MKKMQAFTKVFQVNSTPVYFLDTIEETKVLSEILIEDNTKEFAIDQERAPYNKFYFQKPCLVQIASDSFIVFIDLLSEEDILKPLIPIFENPSIEKIFFDAPWDLYYFQKHMNIDIQSIRDIQIVSSLLSPTQATASLITLAKEEFNVDIVKPKSQQKSDWTRRPLTANQIRYASHEILWFLPIYKSLYEKLKGLVPFYDYGISRIKLDIPNLDYSPMNVRRIKGYSELSYPQQHKLVQLGVARDKIAQRRNKPSFFILNNNQLIQLAKNESLRSILTSRQKLSRNDRAELNDASNQTYPDTPIENPTTPFSDHPPLKQHLLNWRFTATKKFGLPKRFIISNNHVDNFDESTFLDKGSLFHSLWFTSNDSLLCRKLTDDLDKFLKTVELD